MSSLPSPPRDFEVIGKQAALELMDARRPLASKEKPQERVLTQFVTGHWFAYGMCIYYALINQAEVYKDKQLKVVIGSFGLGKGSVPHWEYGNPTYTKAKQFILPADGRSTDLHVWLEDSEGLIYDILSNEYLGVAFLHGKTTEVLAQNPELIDGVAPKTLAARGFHYLAAPSKAQKDLWLHMIREHASPFKQLGLALPATLNGAAV